jgi:hypothetical protein
MAIEPTQQQPGLLVPKSYDPDRPLLIVPEGVSKRYDNKRPTQRETKRPIRWRLLNVICGFPREIVNSIRPNRKDGSPVQYQVQQDGSLRRITSK